MPKSKHITKQASEQLLAILQSRFEGHPQRHPGISWDTVHQRLLEKHPLLWSLQEMELTGGEPDVVVIGTAPGRLTFIDCAPETPGGRRSICFDGAARLKRKEHKPRSSALEMAEEMGITILNEAQYYALQNVGAFDLKTSSWVATPDAIRERGGALFCDQRFGRVFTYHNGAESYYASRGFRGLLEL